MQYHRETFTAPPANYSTNQRVNQSRPYLVNVALVALFLVAS
jgi:hypothetical protein